MRKMTTAVLAIALAGTGCRMSNVSSDASVQISGRALDASGKPLANAKVLFFKEADIGQVVVGAVFAIGSLGTVCLLPEAPSICAKARTTTTGSDGRYAFDLKGSDTQGSVGTEAVLDVVFSDPKVKSGGTSTTVSFNARQSTVKLPDARLWNASPQVQQGDGKFHVTFSGLSSSNGSKPTYSAQVFTDGQEGAIWSQAAQAGTADIDARVLEDRSGTVAVGARATLSGGSGGGTVHANYLSTRTAVSATAGAPPSRGRSCAAVTGAVPVAAALGACAATDGDLVKPARLSSGKPGIVTGVVIDRGSDRPVNLVVVRGVAGQFLVEVSSDGKAYRVVSTQIGSAVAVSPAGAPSARFVRVRSASALDESMLSEVSVW
jgi:hypothetical protein